MVVSQDPTRLQRIPAHNRIVTRTVRARSVELQAHYKEQVNKRVSAAEKKSSGYRLAAAKAKSLAKKEGVSLKRARSELKKHKAKCKTVKKKSEKQVKTINVLTEQLRKSRQKNRDMDKGLSQLQKKTKRLTEDAEWSEEVRKKLDQVLKSIGSKRLDPYQKEIKLMQQSIRRLGKQEAALKEKRLVLKTDLSDLRSQIGNVRHASQLITRVLYMHAQHIEILVTHIFHTYYTHIYTIYTHR